MTFRLILAGLACLHSLAWAGEWAGDLSVGYLASSGNADTQSLNAKLGLVFRAEPWKNTFAAAAVASSDDEGSTAERYLVGDKLDYSLTERDYLFAAVEWEKDLFAGVRERLSETGGYGRHLLLGPVHTLDAEIGAGYRRQELHTTGEKTEDAIARAALTYGWKISDTSAFAQLLKTEAGGENTYVESVSELKLTVIGALAAILSYTVKHNTDVPSDTEETDTFTAVNLAYSFGEK